MKRLWLVVAGLLFAARLMAANLPYDENANAASEVSRALTQARDNKKNVLLVFGANWCPECRRLDGKIHDKAGKLGDEKYVIVKVDVGNFDKNIDLARSYGNPIRKGIPGAAILAPDGRTLYAGPLSRVVEPQRRIIKIALFATTMLGILLAAATGVVILRRKKFPAAFFPQKR
jgi:thioredoxin 1